MRQVILPHIIKLTIVLTQGLLGLIPYKHKMRIKEVWAADRQLY